MKRSITFLFYVLVLIITTSNCFANNSLNLPDANAPVTLQEYLSYAALNNAGLKAAFEEWKSALQQVPQVKALPDPQFTYGYFIEEVETRASPQAQRFQLMQVFPWFGTIEARTDAAAAVAKAAQKRYDAAKLKLFYEVKDAFYEYTYLARAVEIARENLELIKHFEEVARTKYMAAAATHPDVILAQVELAKLEYQLKAVEELRKPIVTRLNAVLNHQRFEMLPWPEKEEFHIAKLDRQQMIEILRSNNPELAAFDFELEAARYKIELAKKRFYPDIGVGVEWMTNEAMMGDDLSGGKKDEVILMFGLNLPIWRQSYKAAELQAKADLNKTLHQKKDAENTFIARAAGALYDFEDSNRRVKLYDDALVPKAQELLGASETAYKAGTIDFLSLINAQQKLLEFQLDYERAVTDNQQRLAELEMLVGAQLPTVSKEKQAAAK